MSSALTKKRTKKPASTSRLNQSCSKPTPFAKAPTLIGWYQPGGKPRPSNRPPPEREDTGTSRPEKFTAGTTDRMAVANTADTCVRVRVEMSCPKPVVADTYNKVPSTSVARDPLTGTPNRKTASITSSTKLIIATAM